MTLLIPPHGFIARMELSAALKLADVLSAERRFRNQRAGMAGRCARLARVADAIIARELARESDPAGIRGRRWSSHATWELNRRVKTAMSEGARP